MPGLGYAIVDKENMLSGLMESQSTGKQIDIDKYLFIIAIWDKKEKGKVQ